MKNRAKKMKVTDLRVKAKWLSWDLMAEMPDFKAHTLPLGKA